MFWVGIAQSTIRFGRKDKVNAIRVERSKKKVSLFIGEFFFCKKEIFENS